MLARNVLTVLVSAFLVGTEGVFIINPKSVIVFLNFTAEFRCQNLENNVALEWRINGTGVSVNHPPEVTIQGGNPRVLRLVATSKYNGTVFDCVADSSTSNVSEISENATVLIQGYLSAVGSVNMSIMPSKTLITWTAPFTLNVTDGEPDITYRVNITHMSDNRSSIAIRGHVPTNYTVVSDESSPCGRFNFIVTPENGVGVGPPSREMIGYVFTSDETCTQVVTHNETVIRTEDNMGVIIAAATLIPVLGILSFVLIIVVIVIAIYMYRNTLCPCQ